MIKAKWILIGLMLFGSACNSQTPKEMDYNACGNLDSLVQSINENPDILHLDYTPSVHQLSECGIPAIRAVLPLLDSPEEWERIRAQRVVEGVVQRMNGWRPGSGYPADSKGQKLTLDLLELNGDFQYSDPVEKRKESIEKWKIWLSRNEPAEQNGK